MKLMKQPSGFTFVEIMVTSLLIGVVGLIVFSLLNIGTILSAKNIAVNTAHQQARTAMLQMIQDIHGSVSLPQLVDVNGAALPTPSPGATAPPAEGIAFQAWSMGPFQVCADANAGQKVIQLQTTGGQTPIAPVTGAAPQRLILPVFEIEDDIMSVAPLAGGKVNITLANNLPVAVKNTGSSAYHVVAYVTDRCSYIVQNRALDWKGPNARVRFAVMGSGITNPTPFTTPLTQNGTGGAYDYKFIAAIDLSTADSKYSARNFKAANILLNGKVPLRARLTKYQ